MADAGGRTISVEVVFATPERQRLVELDVEQGATVADAIGRSGLADRFSGIDLDALAVGIWGRTVERDHVLRDGDRVEIYRPLSMDPREARRKLAAVGATMGARRDPD